MAEPNIAGGRLLGTAKVQEGVDDVGKSLKELASEIRKLAGLARATYAPGSNMSAAVPMGFGKGLGGDVSFSGLSSSQTRGAADLRPYASDPRGTMPTQASPTTPNGGGASFGQRAMGFGAALGTAAISYGDAKMATQAGYEYTSRYAMGGNGRSFGDINRALFTNRLYGQSQEDVQQAAATFTSTMGMQAGSSAFMGRYNQFGGVSAVNPLMSAGALSQAYAHATSSQGYWGMQRFGISTVGANGNPIGMNKMFSQISSRVMGFNPNRSWTNNEIQSSFNDQNSNINNNLRMLVQQGTITQDMADAYLQTERSYAQASQSGMSRKQFNSLASKAGTDSAARDQLAAAGVTNLDNMISAQQEKQGIAANRDVNMTESFAAGMKAATDVVNKFSQAITDFLNKTGLDKGIGYGSGGLAALAGGAGGGLGMLGGLMAPFKIPGMGGGTGMLSRIPGLGGLFGGGSGATAAGGTAAAGGGLGAFGTTAAVAAPFAALGAIRYKGIQDATDGNAPTSLWGKAWESTGISSALSNMANLPVPGLDFNMPGIGGGGSGAVGGSSGNRPQSSGKPTVSGDAIVKYAMSFVNKVPYVFGGTTPAGWDCSGFVQYVFNHFGVSLPRLAGDQARAGRPVSKGSMRPGDLVFFEVGAGGTGAGSRADHVGIYIGPGKMVNAPHTGAMTRVDPIWSTFTHARRFVGAGSGGFDGRNGKQDRNSDTSAGNGAGGAGGIGAGTEADVVAAALSGGVMGATIGGNTGGAGSGGSGGNGSGGSSWSGKGAMGGAQLLSTLRRAGFSGTALQTAWAVAMAESGGRPGAHVRDSDDNSYGLFQINMLGSMGPARRAQYGLKSNSDLYDPLTNAKIAYQMSGGGRNWGPWGAYTNGSYKQYMNDVPGYEKGAFRIDGDQLAMVHNDEMILKADVARAVRSSLTGVRDSGGRGGVTLIFRDGAIRIGSAGSDDQAKRFGRQVVDAITNDDRIKRLQAGV